LVSLVLLAPLEIPDRLDIPVRVGRLAQQVHREERASPVLLAAQAHKDR